MPEASTSKMEVPKKTTKKTPAPKHTPSDMKTPDYHEVEVEMPKPGHIENCITVGNEQYELFPTKLKYQRDRTAAFYRILQTMPLVDILALDQGILDPERSSDKMLFDWLVAVTDNPKFVTRNYDRFDSDIIEQMLHIFCRLNHINEREERKNQQAQVRNL